MAVIAKVSIGQFAPGETITGIDEARIKELIGAGFAEEAGLSNDELRAQAARLEAEREQALKADEKARLEAEAKAKELEDAKRQEELESQAKADAEAKARAEALAARLADEAQAAADEAAKVPQQAPEPKKPAKKG